MSYVRNCDNTEHKMIYVHDDNYELDKIEISIMKLQINEE